MIATEPQLSVTEPQSDKDYTTNIFYLMKQRNIKIQEISKIDTEMRSQQKQLSVLLKPSIISEVEV